MSFIKRLKADYKFLILCIIIILNLLPFILLFFNIEKIRTTIDILNSIAFPMYSPLYTNSPKFINLWYHIFQFNYYILLIHLIFIITSYYILIIRQDKHYVKSLLIVISEVLFAIILIAKEQYFIPLILLYNFSIFTLIMLNNFYYKRPMKWIITILIFISCIGITSNFLFNYFSLNNNDIVYPFNQERSLYDLNYIQSISKLLLYNSLTQIYYSFFGICFIYFIYKLIMKIMNKKKSSKIQFLTKFELKVFISLFSFIFVIQVLYLIGQIAIKNEYLDREINSVTGCYASHMNLGLGENYIGKNNYYFDRCFITSEGIFTVYKEVEKNKNNYFDLIQEVKFKRIILFNEQGKEILSFDLNDEEVNIYVTTNDENKQGYNNLISVEQNYYNDEKEFPNYSFYNFTGELVLELPYGIPDREYTKRDLLGISSMKLLFKDEQIIYKPIIDEKLSDTYIYYLDGTKELLEKE